MPISGVVVTLSDRLDERETALAAIREHPAIEVGQAVAHRVPIVVETADSEEDDLVWQWLHSLAGVELVHVACVHFDEQPTAVHPLE